MPDTVIHVLDDDPPVVRSALDTRAQVAVIIAVRNGLPYITETIASVLAQGDALDALIVVDDGSTDGTLAALSAISDPRLRLIARSAAGVSRTRNAGAEASEAPWLMFLDADDTLAPGALNGLLAGRSPGAVAVYGDYERMDAAGRAGGSRGRIRKHRRKPSGHILRPLLAGNFIINGGVMICARDVVLAVGGFPPQLSLCEDWMLWCRLAAVGPIEYTGELVMNYRVHSHSVMMRQRRRYADFAPAISAIFEEPAITAQIAAPDLRALRRRGECSLMVYSAQQAARASAWRETARLVRDAIAHVPRRAPQIMARVMGAAAGL